MALTKQNTKMTFGDNADLSKVLQDTEAKTKLLQIHLSEQQHSNFKIECLKRGESMKAVVSNLIDQWLREHQ
ncbi:hypothetical protein A1D23_09440 [Chelonobacter oris]|uniref:plasmid partition protein ParG n=1 Tax=Chelonobacter oris TaxID=505317 RepID=UPI00244CF1C2|nr:plasmid partition protein ParG [Chelonobacter oris]MDH3000643.1 hypothetical protein [Chelonobacter oris]